MMREVVAEQALQGRALGAKHECTDSRVGFELAATRSMATMWQITVAFYSWRSSCSVCLQ